MFGWIAVMGWRARVQGGGCSWVELEVGQGWAGGVAASVFWRKRIMCTDACMFWCILCR